MERDYAQMVEALDVDDLAVEDAAENVTDRGISEADDRDAFWKAVYAELTGQVTA